MPVITFTAARIGHADSNGDIFMPGCFRKFDNTTVLLTKEFDHSTPIGSVESFKEDGQELKVTADVPEDCMDLIPAVGFNVLKQESNQHGGKTFLEIRMVCVGLGPTDNMDKEIKPLNKQK